jgi:hypothetical protein
MKNILFIFLFLTSFAVSAQRINGYNKDAFKDLKNTPIVVYTGYGPELDGALKYAVEKYLGFAKVVYKNQQDESSTKASVRLNDYLLKDYGKLYYSAWKFTCEAGGGEFFFDNLRKGDNEFVGIDKDLKTMSYKILPFIMMVSAELKRIDEMGLRSYAWHTGFPERVKDFTVMVPTEYVDNGIPQEAFKRNLVKCEFMKLEDIHKKMVEQKDTDKRAILILAKTVQGTYMNIIDMKTGDMLWYANIGVSSFTYQKKVDDSDMDKLLKKVRKANEK